ncbi:CbtA family protein [Dactylosporangium sp. NPDC051485]|uniref:CbtA family protein n=1 Tax=Dactylosporangium sp. NPDC051485 TaxID=3154846 RepID=UPI003449940C
MEKRIIARGLLAGALAGLAAFVFARIFAEPRIQDAIDYESGRHEAQEALDKAAGVAVAHEHDHELFSRTIQGNVGIGVGMIAFGLAMGALFAVAYAVCLGRVGNLRPRSLAVLLAGAGFMTLYLVPFFKYPANPPAIGHEETIGQRSAFYLIMVLASVLFMILAVVLGQRLKPRFGTWNATLLAAAAFVVVIGVLMALLPAFGELSSNVAEYGHHATETPLPLRDPQRNIVFPGFDADLLFEFRLYTVGAQLLLWTVIGLVFAPMAERLLGARPVRTEPAKAPAAA